jgi:hypothetical protein
MDDGADVVAEGLHALRTSMSEVNSGRVESVGVQVPNDADGTIHGSLMVVDEPPNLVSAVRPTKHGVSRARK